jgi:hypothetical protein
MSLVNALHDQGMMEYAVPAAGGEKARIVRPDYFLINEATLRDYMHEHTGNGFALFRSPDGYTFMGVPLIVSREAPVNKLTPVRELC